MSARAFCRLLAATALVALVGCHGSEPTDAPPPLPQLERPVLPLTARPGGRLLVPRQALVERGGIPGVFVLDEQERARFRMVRVGKRVDGQLEILAGLQGSERLVLGDLAAVHDGSPIRIMTRPQSSEPRE